MLKIVKIGGKLIENDAELGALCDRLRSLYPEFVLVHGGGSLAASLSAKLGIVPRMNKGRRITDRRTLDITVMSYAGLANKKLVAALQQRGMNACGLSGCDMNLIVSHRRPVDTIDWGYVGNIDHVDASRIELLLSAGIVPVISPITYSPVDGLLNTNADSVASAVASAMAAVRPTECIFCLDLPGVLLDVEDRSSVIPTIDRRTYRALSAEGKIFSGMIPKLDNAFNILDAGVSSVRLTDPEHFDGGTRIV